MEDPRTAPLRTPPLARWEVDWSEWPVARVRLDRPTGAAEPDFATFLSASDAIAARRERHALVLDLAGSRGDAGRRARLARWFDENRALLEQYLVALAVVARNPVHRGAITAMVWLRRPPFLVETFASETEARLWARKKIDGGP